MSDAVTGGSAIINGDYRYFLARWWDGGMDASSVVTFVMLNPSTADAAKDDATIRRCIGFAKREGYKRLEVVNLFAYRTHSPKKLAAAPDPLGPMNDIHVNVAVRGAALVICAWGASKHANSGSMGALFSTGRPLYCLGHTANGSPRHPLYLPANAALEPWDGDTANECTDPSCLYHPIPFTTASEHRESGT
jgi:hypothetical protein